MSHKSTKIIAAISLVIFLLSFSASAVAFVVVLKQKALFIESLKKQAETEARSESQKGLEEALQKTKSERALLSSQILEDTNVIELLSLIETLGKEQGVMLTTNSLNVEKIDKRFETLVVNLDVIGTYTQVMYMLSLLEHIPYQSTVASVQLEREDEGEDARWKGNFVLKVTKFKKNEI